jgi:hypothetical protein
VLAALCIRPDLAGVTSLLRALGLRRCCYYSLLHFFHSNALNLEALTRLWCGGLWRLLPRHIIRVGARPVVLVDGLKRPKEGRKMPGVKSLHQESGANSKPEFIMGHSLQAVALLVRGAATAFALPVAARIHEGVVWSNRDRRSLLDKLGALLLALPWPEPVTVVADAYYAAGKFARCLLQYGHHLVTRVRSNAIAFFPIAPAPSKRRGRPRKYGRKTHLRDWFRLKARFTQAASPVYGEQRVQLLYYSRDLLWRPVGRLVRFVWVIHPSRGRLILLCTDLALNPLDIIRLYGWRFKIEVGFKQAIHTLGTYAYHFWMQAMTPIRRGHGNQHLHRKSEGYRQGVRRKLAAYERHIQLGLIAQGLMVYLALCLLVLRQPLSANRQTLSQPFRGCGPSRPAQHLVGFSLVFPTGHSAQEIPHPKTGSVLPRHFRSFQPGGCRLNLPLSSLEFEKAKCRPHQKTAAYQPLAATPVRRNHYKATG